MGIRRFGFHAQPTFFVLTFDQALDLARATNVANYRIRRIGGRGDSIPIAAASYNAGAHAVTLRMAHPVRWRANYEVVVQGSGPVAVSNADGVALNAASASQPGTNAVLTFGRSVLAGPASVISPTWRRAAAR
jgi:type VI secretion system secreted protein VgrG